MCAAALTCAAAKRPDCGCDGKPQLLYFWQKAVKGMRVEADIYLLDIRDFFEDEERGGLIEAALSKLDEERREKARRIGREKGMAESLGAGLLLQLAVRSAESVQTARFAGGALTRWAVRGLKSEA